MRWKHIITKIVFLVCNDRTNRCCPATRCLASMADMHTFCYLNVCGAPVKPDNFFWHSLVSSINLHCMIPAARTSPSLKSLSRRRYIYYYIYRPSICATARAPHICGIASVLGKFKSISIGRPLLVQKAYMDQELLYIWLPYIYTYLPGARCVSIYIYIRFGHCALDCAPLLGRFFHWICQPNDHDPHNNKQKKQPRDTRWWTAPARWCQCVAKARHPSAIYL